MTAIEIKVNFGCNIRSQVDLFFRKQLNAKLPIYLSSKRTTLTIFKACLQYKDNNQQ